MSFLLILKVFAEDDLPVPLAVAFAALFDVPLLTLFLAPSVALPLMTLDFTFLPTTCATLP